MPPAILIDGDFQPMVKPEWGAKRTCPKCATRFYDLGKDDPVTCIECGATFVPEPVLKSKQPMPFEQVSVAAPSAMSSRLSATASVLDSILSAACSCGVLLQALKASRPAAAARMVVFFISLSLL